MSNPILGAIQQIAREKKIPEEEILKTIEAALAAAYRKDFGNKMQNVQAQFDPKTGALRVFDVKEVVEDELKAIWEKEQAEREAAREAGIELPLPEPARREPASAENAEGEEEKRFNPKSMIALADAQVRKADAAIGDELREELPITGEFGRMAAQTAKQVIIQRLREAERAVLYAEWEDKAGTLQAGTIQRFEGRNIVVDITNNTSGILPPQEQVQQERYRFGQRMKFYVVSVNKTGKGPEIVLSRSHPNLVRALFTMEVPEIEAGSVEVKAVAREAGARSKVAVVSHEENVDPIGACIGQRGTRVQTVIGELGGEKIDVIQWEEDGAAFIKHALAPAKVIRVELEEAGKSARVIVADDQLSLAIGRSGQNVRLAAKLTGWQINIMSQEKPEEVQGSSEQAPVPPVVDAQEQETPASPPAADQETKAEEVVPEQTQEPPVAGEKQAEESNE